VPLPLRQSVRRGHRLFRAAARPVVTAALVPAGQPLRYYHRVAGHAGAMLEGFEVPDDFLLDHRLGTRPERGVCFGSWPERSDPITAEALGRLPSLAGAGVEAAI